MLTYALSLCVRLLVNWFVLNITFVTVTNLLTPAFIIGSAIPQVATITGLIGAIAIMQFSYTFPPLLLFEYNVITDAAGEDHPHVPGSGGKGRIDSWRDWSRWKRVSVKCLSIADSKSDFCLQGLFGGPWYTTLFKTFNLVLGLAGLSTACLGMWGAGEAVKATFQIAGAATSFGCTAPV